MLLLGLEICTHPLHSFNLGETSEGSGQCVGALSGEDVGLGDNVWLLGDRYVTWSCALLRHEELANFVTAA